MSSANKDVFFTTADFDDTKTYILYDPGGDKPLLRLATGGSAKYHWNTSIQMYNYNEFRVAFES